MDERYNDLSLNPNNPDTVTPPSSLSLADQQAWVRKRLAAVKDWEKMLTPAYFQQSRGPVLQALQSQLDKLDREAALQPPSGG